MSPHYHQQHNNPTSKDSGADPVRNKDKLSFAGKNMQQHLFDSPDITENEVYLEQQLITYLGNKRALLPFIGVGLAHVKKRIRKPTLSCLDLFSGTGVVARFLKAHSSRIVANDLELYSRVTNECYLSNVSSVPIEQLKDGLNRIETRACEAVSPGFITELYSPIDEKSIKATDRVFFTKRNAIYIDAARQAIEQEPAELKHFYLGPLLSSASIHANTSGVFKGFYKNAQGIGQYGGSGRDALTRILKPIKLELPTFSRFDVAFKVYQEDANKLVRQLSADSFDVAYFDPPYNQHPYGSNYFMLNVITTYERPKTISRVSGIPSDWNRSAYNVKQDSEDVLFDAIENCPARFILLSYNSEGYIKPERFLQRLKHLGDVKRLETTYNAFRGSRNLASRPIYVTEFLYLLEKKSG